MTTTYTVTSPLTGKTHSRKSKKSHYTHVALVTLRRIDGSVFEEVSYRGSKDAAESRVRQLVWYWGSYVIDSAVVEVAQ